MTRRILVTGVGGGVGQSIIKSLAGTRYEVVGIDPDPLAVGLHAVPIALRGPTATDESFIPTLLSICESESCTMVLPGLDSELFALSSHSPEFAVAGIQVIVSSPGVIEVADDKARTVSFLAEHGFKAPATVGFTTDVDDLWFPLVLKPQRGGSRSHGVYVVKTRREFDAYAALIDADNYVIQEYVDGDEYTCGTVTLDGRCHGVIAMRRILRAGDTYRAFVVRNLQLEEHVRAIADALKPTGACNIQLRLRQGIPYVFEINPRCSGTTYARTLAGFNEPGMIADWVFDRVLPSFEIQEITVLRYWKELVVPADRPSRLAKGERVEGGDLPL